MAFFKTLIHTLQVSEKLGKKRDSENDVTTIPPNPYDSKLHDPEQAHLCAQASINIQSIGNHFPPPGDGIEQITSLDNLSPTIKSSSEVITAEVDGRHEAPRTSSTHLQNLHPPITGAAELPHNRLEKNSDNNKLNHTKIVDKLVLDALEHRAVRHPYLTALSQGTLPDTRAALADFARHYYGYSAHFPRYLTALISKLERPEHRSALLENLTEESGQYESEELAELQQFGVEPEWIIGIPHPQLFQRFRDAIGVGDTEAADDHIEVVCWRELFLAVLTHGSAAEALGALGLGTESIVQTIYQPFCDAIERLGTLAPQDTVFFPLHTAVDDHHQATLKAIATDFVGTSQGLEDLSKGMRKALALRDAFWDWLLERALAQPPAA